MRRYTSEDIIHKLREADVFLGHEPPPPGTAATPETGALRRGRYPYRAKAPDPGDLRHDYDRILVEERYRVRSPVPVTVLRLPMVYGPGDPQRRVASDLARLRLATTHADAPGKTYNVGEPDAITTREWLAAIAQALAVPIRIQDDPAAVPSLPVRWTVSLVTATDRIRRELGYLEPVGRTEGVRRTARAAAA